MHVLQVSLVHCFTLKQDLKQCSDSAGTTSSQGILELLDLHANKKKGCAPLTGFVKVGCALPQFPFLTSSPPIRT